LLLDEPLAALDGRLKRQILPFLRRVRGLGVPMLYVSHSLDEILYLAPTLALVDHGRILGHGACLDMLGLKETDDIIDSAELRNLWSVDIAEDHPGQGYSVGSLAGQRLVLPLAPDGAGKATTVGVRAAQIALSRRPLNGVTIQNQLAGRIVRLIPRRHGALVEIDLGGVAAVAEVNAKTVEDLGLRAGEPTYCLIKAQSIEYPDC
jgi:molybdate transport system ATP-binding protein